MLVMLKKTNLPRQERYGHSAAVIGDAILILGGYGPNGWPGPAGSSSRTTAELVPGAGAGAGGFTLVTAFGCQGEESSIFMITAKMHVPSPWRAKGRWCSQPAVIVDDLKTANITLSHTGKSPGEFFPAPSLP